MVAIADIRQVVADAGQLAVGYYGKVTGSVLRQRITPRIG